MNSPLNHQSSTVPRIGLGQWAFQSRMKVEEAANKFRHLKDKHVATRRFADFLAFNFGDKAESAGVRLGVVPDWAFTEAERLLEYDRTSPHAFGSNVIVLAFKNAKHWPLAA